LRIIKVVLFFVIGLFLFSSVGLQAQRQVENMPAYDLDPFHFGFVLAINQMHFTVKPLEGLNFKMFDEEQSRDFSGDSSMLYSVEHDPSVGFTVGIVTNLRLGRYFDLRFIPSLSFGERYLDYRILKFRDMDKPTILNIRKNIPSTFVELPFHLKYKAMRMNNFRPYVLSGFNYRIDLASQANKKNEAAAKTIIKLKRSDIYFEIGMGVDFYFEWFKMGTEVKMSYGALDIMKRENNIYTDGIDKLNSKIFQFSLTFE
jgi:hypothetical protein